MSKKKKTMKTKKDGVFVEGEKTLEIENSELEKMHFEMVINHIKDEYDEIFQNKT